MNANLAARQSFPALAALLLCTPAVRPASAQALTSDISVMMQTKVRAGVTTGTARAALTRTLAATNKNLSWRLFCQPRTTTCALNLHIVAGPSS